MTTATATPRTDRAAEALRRSGNPFRNYFARNPDDEVCARSHVPELFAAERDLLHAVIDLYRYDPMTHSEVVPVLGNKGAGKTHLLHSIKHGVGEVVGGLGGRFEHGDGRGAEAIGPVHDRRPLVLSTEY